MSLESKVDNLESTISRFNSQFLLNKTGMEAVDWALPLEYEYTMFRIVNVYTKAVQIKNCRLKAASDRKRSEG